MTPEERFWRKVDTSGGPDACWIWTGCILRSGYGQFRDGRMFRAHRWSYIQANGAIPDGLVIDHLCRTLACVNPAHLEAVTQTVNVRRGAHGGKTECKWGHPFTPENTGTHPRGGRVCKTCAGNRARAQQERRRSAA